MKEVLEDIGLSAIEARVYLKLCQIGSCTAYVIAKESQLYKANTYDALKKLESRGLVSGVKKDSRIIYQALEPERFLQMIHDKQDKIMSIIPQLRALQDLNDDDSSVSIMKGTSALKTVMYQMLEYNKPIYTWGVPKDAYPIIRFWTDAFHQERIKKKVKMYHIYNYEATERVRTLSSLPYTPIRHLPVLFDSRVATSVCGDLITLKTYYPVAKVIRIKDRFLAESYSKYFMILWKAAKPFPKMKFF